MHMQFECNLCVLNLVTQSECNGYVLSHFPQKHCGVCEKSLIQIGDEWYELRIHASDQCGADLSKNTGITFVTVPECVKLERSPSPFLTDYDVKEEPAIENDYNLSTPFGDNDYSDMNGFTEMPPMEVEASQMSYQADDDRSESQLANDQIKFKCDLCDRDYQLKGSLQRHMKIDHNQKMEKTYNCPWCNQVFDRKQLQLRHIESIHKDKTIDCEICGKSCASKGFLQTHMIKVHKQKLFNFQTDGNHSAESQTANDEKNRLKCALCDKVYSRRGGLQRHMKEIHNQKMKTTYSCPWCNDVFDGRKLQSQHIETIHKTKTVDCQVCGISCYSESILQKHLTEEHKQELFTKTPEAEMETSRASYQADDDHSAESQSVNNKLSRFKCDLCDRGYWLNGSLQRHMKVDHNQQMKAAYNCPWCIHVFDSRKRQLQHIKRVHKDKEVVCEICGKSYALKRFLKKHLTEVHKQKLLQCTICPAAFIDGKLLLEHTKENHKELGYECELCEMKFVSSISLSRHLRKQHSQHKCKSCDEIFYEQERFASHVKEMHIESIRVCEACGETFYTKHNFRRHLERFPGHSEEKEFMCLLCKNIFNRRRELTQHYKNVHKGEKFVCDICSKEFELPSTLKYHRDTHAGVNEPKRFPCKICDKSFSRNRFLTYHKTIHTKKPYITCDICEKQFTHKHYLQLHMRLHYNKRRFLCEVCDKAFRDAKSLDIHRQIVHEKKILFECDICRKNFTKKKYLVEHMIRHTNPNDFKFICDHCGKGFHQRGSLKDHIDRHNGVKSHACSHCDKSFVKSSTLRNHQQVHSDERQYKCTIKNCSRAFKSRSSLSRHLTFSHGTFKKKHVCSICSKIFPFEHMLRNHLETHEKTPLYAK